MAVTPEWIRSHELLGRDIAKAARRDGLNYKNITDLVNTSQRYPSVVPVLIDWLKNLDDRTPLTDPRDLANFRDGLCRALTTLDAIGTGAVPLLIDQFYLEPPLPEVNAYAAGNALRFLAVPSDYDEMATIAADRSLGSGRAAVLEWIIKQGPPKASNSSSTKSTTPASEPSASSTSGSTNRYPADFDQSSNGTSTIPTAKYVSRPKQH